MHPNYRLVSNSGRAHSPHGVEYNKVRTRKIGMIMIAETNERGEKKRKHYN